MQEPAQSRQPKPGSRPRWTVGAIATAMMLGAAGWFCPPIAQAIPADGASPSSAAARLTTSTARTPLPDPEPQRREVQAIAVIIGGIVLWRRFRSTAPAIATVDLNGANLNGADLNGIDLSSASLIGANLNGANLAGANLAGANLSGINLISANLSGADLSGANLRYADLSEANLVSANLSSADLRQANLSGADLNCTILSDANLGDANLSGALLFFTNLRDVLNLELLQLEAQPSPILCHVALPTYSQQPEINPNRACNRLPHLLSARYDLSPEEAQGIVNEARQHRWD